MSGSLTQSEIKKYLAFAQFQPGEISHFVETGTFRATTTREMASLFDRVDSIEIKETLYHEALESCQSFPSIHLHLGDSSAVLESLVFEPDFQHPIVFFLDGHWCGDHTGCGEKDCPLVEELLCITSRPFPDLIIVDDIRLFGLQKQKPGISKSPDWTLITEDALLDTFSKRTIRTKWSENDRLMIQLEE